jgi:PAS domain S-box-containing protein/putative nucleotidyltransferase with HDIG domain
MALAVNWAPTPDDRKLLYALSWTYAQDAKFAFDAFRSTILDVNPAGEALTGYSRDELIGTLGIELHPENERESVKSIVRRSEGEPTQIKGFHVKRKDGGLVPVAVSASEAWMLAGRTVVVCVFRDITDQIEKEHRLSTQNWALSAYAGAALALGRARSPEGLLQAICEAITRESVYLAAWVGVAEDGRDKPIRVAASAGNGAGYLEGLRLSWSEEEPEGMGPTGVCIRTNVLQILEDSETSPVYGPWRERARQFGIRSSVSIPLSVEGGWRGALIVYAGRPHAFEPAPVEVFERLAEQMVHGIRALDQERQLETERQKLSRTQAQLTTALSAMVAPIVTAMEMRDPYTAGHQSRVAEIACAIGREMGWAEERLHGLRVAALVHDIGKISIPAEILTKPGKLNAAEWSMICSHPETGYTILKDIPFPWPVAEIVRQHHEKLDGSGYPAGLKGDEILPEAKVLTVADIVEAMASFRPYRPGVELDLVMKQIESEAGTKLDAAAVRTCVTLFRERNFMVPGWIRR